MGTEGRSPRESETRNIWAENLLCVLLVAGLHISFNQACLAQQGQRVERSQTQNVSQTATDSPKAAGQAQQSAAPAQIDAQIRPKEETCPTR
jgi:hypothetical protein